MCVLFLRRSRSFSWVEGKMSVAMDKALMAMSLEDEDAPFVMPDLPEYSSCERNVLSLIGGTLNPYCQTVSGVVHSMPRKRKKTGRTRGIALSKERFQFIFTNEYDLGPVRLIFWI